METTLMIKCDIKHAPEILLAAQKVIERAKEKRVEELKQAITAVNNSISVREWMGLHAEQKVEYICRDTEGNEFDIGIFDRERNGMACELCNEKTQAMIGYVIGTKDSREPKYCFNHYESINVFSRFIKGRFMKEGV